MAISQRSLAKLKDPALATDKAPVAGEWLGCEDVGKKFDVLNASTGERIATLPDMGPTYAGRAIEAAYIVQKHWAKRTGKERAAILRKLHDLMVANADDLAVILAMVMGKPLAELALQWFFAGEPDPRTLGLLGGRIDSRRP